MKTKRLADLGKDSTDNKDNDVTHTAAAFITTTSLSSVNISSSASDLSDDESVTLKLKDKNWNSDFAPTLTLPIGKVNKYNFEECIKLSKPIAPITSGSIKQMFHDKGTPEGTASNQVLEISSKFDYHDVVGKFMYVYLTCRPDIGYVITTLSKFSLKPSYFHHKLLPGVAKYLWSTIIWGIRFNQPSPQRVDSRKRSFDAL